VHVEEELARRLEYTIKKREIDIVSLDPLVKTHSVDENANNAVDFVVSILARIAVRYNCAVDVPHHVSKGPSAAGNADRARGGSAVVDGGRLVYTLWPMSEKEAESFGIDERLRSVLVRMDRGKVNLAPPGTGTCWFKLVGVPIGNPSPLYPNGDDVQTVEPWTPPATWGGASYAQLNEILSNIDRGLPNGSRFSNLPKVGDRAAHLIVQKHLPGKTEGQAREIIKTWIKNHVLNYVDYEDPVVRKDRKGLRLDPTKRPG
jgi:AAA domain-containing protein